MTGIEVIHSFPARSVFVGTLIEILSRVAQCRKTPFTIGAVTGLHVNVMRAGRDGCVVLDELCSVDRKRKPRCVDRNCYVTKHPSRQNPWRIDQSDGRTPNPTVI